MSAETLRLATLNVWALPLGVSRHDRPRMVAIGERVAELAVDAVAFQEVWTEEARQILLEATARAGLDHAWHHPQAFGGSGLLLCSRRPFMDVAFERFALRGLPQRIHHGDYWGGKGFVRVRLPTAAGPLTLLTTHLHAQYTPDPVDEYRGIRTGQIVQLAAAIHALRDPVLALGDFNVRAGNPDYEVLVGLTGFTDVALALDKPEDTALASNPYRGAGHGGDERIDYAFVRTGTRIDAVPKTIAREFDAARTLEGEPGAYSDHAGLLLEVEVVPVPPRTLPAAAPDALTRARALFNQGRLEAERRRGVERSLALGTAALAAAALPGASQLRASRRLFLAGLASGLGLAAIPGALASGWLSEVAVGRELAAYDRMEALLGTFVPAS